MAGHTGRGGARRVGPDGSAAQAELNAALVAAQAGGESAFADLYREAQPRLLRYARLLAGADAEDVCAEAWLHIVRDLGDFRGDHDAFKAWTARIVRNRAIDHARARTVRPTTPLDQQEVNESASITDAFDGASENLSTTAALALIASLPPEQAEAVFLRAVIGFDAAAAGEILGKSAGAVRVAAHRGLKELRRRLLDDAIIDPPSRNNFAYDSAPRTS